MAIRKQGQFWYGDNAADIREVLVRDWGQIDPITVFADVVCDCGGRDVHYCRSEKEALEFADAGECVAIDSRKARLPLRLLRRTRGRTLLGRVAPRGPARLPLRKRGRGGEDK